MTQKEYARSSVCATKSKRLTPASHKNQLHRPGLKTGLTDVVCPFAFELYCDEVDRVTDDLSTFPSSVREVLPQATNSQKRGISSDTSTRADERGEVRNDQAPARASRTAPSVSAGNGARSNRLDGGRRDASTTHDGPVSRSVVNRDGARHKARAFDDRRRLDALSALRMVRAPAKCSALPSVQSAARGAR
jgi:hypothetical protein